MMYVYVRYIIGRLVAPFLLLLLALGGVIWLTQSLRFTELIVDQGLSIILFMKMSLLLIPSMLFMVFPIATFLAVLQTYHHLALDSELTILETAGASPLARMKPAIYFAAFVTLLAGCLSLVVIPASYRVLKETETKLSHRFASVLLREGSFNTPIKGVMVYIASRTAEGVFEGVMVHDQRDAMRQRTVTARTARLLQDQGHSYLVLHDGNQQQRQEDGQLITVYFDHYPIDLEKYISRDTPRTPELEERSLRELLSGDPLRPDLDERLHAEAQRRLMWPLYNFVLGSLAALLVVMRLIHPRRYRHAMLQHCVVGAVLFGIGIALLVGCTKWPFLRAVHGAYLLAWVGIMAVMLRSRTSRLLIGAARGRE